jgi:hypothetical protein
LQALAAAVVRAVITAAVVVVAVLRIRALFI